MNEPIAHGKRKHASFAPSGSSRWLTCPGSVALSQKAGKQVESIYALEGTIAHEVLEFVVRRYGNLGKASEAALLKYSKHPAVIKHGFDYNAMVEHAVTSAEIVYSLRPSPSAKLLIETRVVLSKEVWGSLDYAWLEDWGTLVIIDYKYGAGVPVLPIDDEGEEDTQLMTYGAALAKKYGYEFDAVKLAVIQPRVWKDDANALSEGMTTVKKLRLHEKRCVDAVLLAKTPNAPLKYSEKACRWCPAASFCPEISKGQMDIAEIAFDIEKGVTKLPKFEALTSTQLPVLLSACDALETWIEKVRARALYVAMSGEKIGGKKLVQKISDRFWKPKAEVKLKKLFGNGVYESKLLSPAKLEKKFGKPAKDFTKKFTDRVPTGYTLAKVSDKRPEITSTVAFDIVDESERSD